MLNVGDHVYYKAGGFPVEVLEIEMVVTGKIHGLPTHQALILDRSVVVSLSNGHWAYGDQIDPVDGYCKQCGDPLERGCSELCIGCEKIDQEKWED